MKLSPKQREALELVAGGRFFPCLLKEDDGWHARWRAIGAEGNGWVDEYVREANVTRLSEDAEDQKHETLHDAWMMALRSRTGLVRWDDAACAAFAAELEVWSGNAAEDRDARGSIVFAFGPSAKTADARFSVTCAVPKGRRCLKALGLAAYVWPPLVGLRAEGPERLCVTVTRTEADDFVRRGARNLRDAGYGVTGADIASPVTVAAEIGGDARPHDPRPTPVTLVVHVAGEPVTAEEIRFLLDQGSSLVFFRNRWIEVDRGILKEALRALERIDRRMPKMNALAFALGIGRIGNVELEAVRTHGWLRGLVNELKASGTLESSVALGDIPGFRGVLRDYQKRGVEWLRFLTDHKFGALLADDMGLGKTIQVIAWLLVTRPKPMDGVHPAPVLIVAPLTLLSNWKHELARFAPSLKIYVHQGERRRLASGFRLAVGGADVTLTSYNLLVRESSAFSEVAWEAMVLDEAQMIKNPDAQVSRAACALMPPKRIALTGTPIENSVADIWALENFLNPGFLGERRSFVERFVKPISADDGSAAGRRLRSALDPFVLRRLKSDPRIVSELGEKREVREYCELTPEQRRDYEVALQDFRATEHAQGDVFALITRLKLVCDGAAKFERLCELLTAVFAAGESALVFTQYAKIGDWLVEQLAQRFGRRFPFLHGGLSVREREATIARFNKRGPTVFILSLKAGGFGLNLVKATHVIHYDRWWNPAVEDQATDRAHRIGQTKTVFSHIFISAGTLEEHVDEILMRKSRVAGAVISEAEWLEAARLDEQS